MRLQGQYEKQLDSIKAAIEDLHRTELIDDDTQRALLSLRGLAEEKSLYVDMFNKGHLSERAFRQLLLTLQLQIDTVRGRGVYHDVPPAPLCTLSPGRCGAAMEPQGGLADASGSTVTLAAHRDGL